MSMLLKIIYRLSRPKPPVSFFAEKKKRVLKFLRNHEQKEQCIRITTLDFKHITMFQNQHDVGTKQTDR